MRKEAPRNQVDSFNFNQDGSSPFDMIASGAFSFEASVSAPPNSSEMKSDSVVVSINSPLTKIINFEERLARRRNPAVKVDISRRDWLVQEIKSNQNSVIRLAEVAMAAARRDAENCATDGHANKSTAIIGSSGELFTASNVKSISSKSGHKEGHHEHCSNCGGDLTDGKCSKCAA